MPASLISVPASPVVCEIFASSTSDIFSDTLEFADNFVGKEQLVSLNKFTERIIHSCLAIALNVSPHP